MKLLRLGSFFCNVRVPFLKLVKPPIGDQEEMKLNQKNIIDEQITMRMNELEATGLSREQIILSKSQKGIPLRIDPFFQYLKTNIKAREVYLRRTDNYTAQNIINIALRQDIGPDPSYARIRDGKIINNQSRAQFMQHLQEPQRTSFDPKSYYSQQQFSVQKSFEQLKPKQPLKHYYKPIDRYNKFKQGIRKLKKYDIHWRNVQLLRQFMTNNSAIRSRMCNMLSLQDHHAVVRAIKTARQMSLLPHIGRVPQPLRRNLTCLEDDVKEIGLQSVDLTSGCIVFTKPPSLDAEQLVKESDSSVKNRYNKMLKEKQLYNVWVSMVKTNEYQEIDSSLYARHLKRNQVKNDKKIDVKEKARQVLRQVTGLRPNNQKEKFIELESYEQYRYLYENDKIKLLETLKQDPVKAIKHMLQQKIALSEK